MNIIIKNHKSYFIQYLVAFITCTILSGTAYSSEATENATSLFRPHFGTGKLTKGDENKTFSHYGGRILLVAGDNKKYGLEITKFIPSDDNENSFNSIGIVIEQRLFNWFNMSIGTIGYFDYGGDSRNIVGLVTNLGWEPKNNSSFKPFITFRNDIVFDDSTDKIYSLSLGFNIAF